MLDLMPPPAQVAPAADPAPGIPEALRHLLDVAIAEGDPATVEKVFGYARRANPDAAQSLDALYATYTAQRQRKAEDAAASAREQLARAHPLLNWAGNVEFGVSLTTGAASSFGLVGAADVERKGVDWTHKVQVRGEVQTVEGGRSVERLTASWQPRHAFGERGYTFGLAQYDHDPNLGYDSRYSVGVGAGLRVGAADGPHVLLDGGPAVRRTEHEDLTRTALAGRGSADLNWPVTDRVTLQQKVAAFYEDGRTDGLSTSSLETQLSRKLKLRLFYEYRFQNEGPVRVAGSTSRASFVLGL